jgi:hypothetical protein
MGGLGGCDFFPNTVNEWDFVRYGTISYGEQIIASDPPGGEMGTSRGKMRGFRLNQVARLGTMAD